MGDSRPVNDLTKKASAPSQDAVKEFKAKVAKVVTRGFVIDRLTVNLPPHLHGEWIRNDPVALAEARALGFEIDKEYAPNSALHRDAAGNPIIGDAIHMTMPKWQKEIIDEVKKQEMEKHHGVRGGKQVGKPAEESQYETNLKVGTPEVPVINESKTEVKPLNAMIQ